MAHMLTFVRVTQHGEEKTHTIPAVHAVCDRCEGHGTYLHSAIGEHAYTREEFAESFDDEESAEYFRRGGRYDMQCDTCHGARVVSVVDEATCARTGRGRRLLALYEAVQEQEARTRQDEANERRYGY